MSKEYLNSYGASRSLVYNIEKYWHDQGYKHVRADVTEFYMADNEELAKRVGARPLYAVRSNIRFADPV